ncbi:myosin-1-like [Cucurbita moschata]|uniref:Myosin-1-like n=1 Tax=Cucurbita moschata TaxID=3662 RepID=A0A6J1H2T3_CUCMO|nr:myosin-1-like [Cucurbita moschata]
MFKSWSKKQKIKAVFKLQFRATQVPKLKKSALMISLVPDDVGKATVKLEKAAIQDGTCFWENPVYETVKLVREIKTGKINEKIYHFVVSTGSSKSGFVGEASIDFADFEAETEPMTVSLPLKFANSGAILHVTIHKMEGDNDQGDIEESGGAALQHENSFNSQLSFSSTEGNHYLTENGDQNTLREDAEQNGNSRVPPGSSSAKFASYWDGNNGERSTQQGSRSMTNGVRSPTLLSPPRQNSMPRKATVDTTRVKNQAHERSNTEWSLGSASDGSFGDSANSPEENTARERMHQVPNSSIERVKNENVMLTRKLEVTELELQSLRKQVTKETIQGQNLSRQIICLTEERDSLKTEGKQLKFLKKCNDDSEDSKNLKSEIKEARVQLAAIGEELKQEKEVRTDLQLQLQITKESNSDLVLAVRDLEEMIELKNRVIADLSRSLESWESDREQEAVGHCKENNDKDPKLSKELIQEYDDVKEVDLLKQEIKDLNSEIEMHLKNMEELEMHLEQLMSENEILKRENSDMSAKLERNKTEYQIKQNEYSGSLAVIRELESEIERLEEKLQIQTEEFSESLISINELEGQIKRLERELEKQKHEYYDGLDAMKHANVKLEKMAIEAKEILSKTRWKSAIKAVILQERSKKFSMEMASKLNDNEKRITKAVKEINELRLQKIVLKEMLQKSKEESRRNKEQNEEKLHGLSFQLELKAKEMHHMSMELDNKSRRLEDAKKQEDYQQEEIQMLKSNIEKINAEKHTKKQAEREQPECLVSEMEALEERSKEKEILEKEMAFSKREVEKAQEELTRIKVSKHEQDTLIDNLLAEMEILRSQINELKKESQTENSEKENLRKQVFQLKSELENKERASGTSNIKLESQEISALNRNLASIHNGSQTLAHTKQELSTSGEVMQLLQETNHSGITIASNKEEKANQSNVYEALCGRKVDSNSSNKELKSSTAGKGTEDCNIDLLKEMSSLKERNQTMERELKEMEERYSEISLKFAEVEGERQQLVMTVRNLKNSKRN